MRWTLIYLAGFTRLWASRKLSDDDLQAIEAEIMRDPSRVPVMRETGGLRKIRFAPPSRGRGKSGSMRVGFAQFPEHRRIYVITMFLKKEAENLNAADRREIKKFLAELTDALRKGRNA